MKPREVLAGVNGMAIPAATSREGILLVNATPWATVYVNGTRVGDTPQQVRLRAGRHRVRLERPNQRGVEADVTVVAGVRVSFVR